MEQISQGILINDDALKFLKEIPSESIDLILTDPPYGKINKLLLQGQNKAIDWDITLDWKYLFQEFNRIIKNGGTIIIFGQPPTYNEMVLANLVDFKYEYIWEKNNCAQGFHHQKMPLIFTENIAVFIHNEKTPPETNF